MSYQVSFLQFSCKVNLSEIGLNITSGEIVPDESLSGVRLVLYLQFLYGIEGWEWAVPNLGNFLQKTDPSHLVTRNGHGQVSGEHCSQNSCVSWTNSKRCAIVDAWSGLHKICQDGRSDFPGRPDSQLTHVLYLWIATALWFEKSRMGWKHQIKLKKYEHIILSMHM